MHSIAPVLVAAGLDWLEGLLPVVFVLIWIVSQVMNLFRNAAGKPGEQPAGRPAKPLRPPARRPRPAGDPAGGDVDQEIQEFLTRALRGDTSPPPVRAASAKPVQRGSARPPAPTRLKPRPAVVENRGRSGGLAGQGGDVAGHVAAAFAHDLAHESPSTLESPASLREPAVADELIAAIRSPADLRKLLMLREVLDRPTHRW